MNKYYFQFFAILRRSLGFTFFVMFVLKPASVMAATSNLCTFADGIHTVNDALSIDGNVTVPRDAPIGTSIAIFQYNPPYAVGQRVAYCPPEETTGVGTWSLNGNVPTFLPGSTTVYRTPLAGVGVKIYRLGKTLPYSVPLTPNYSYYFVDPLYYEFVVTGPVVSSGVITAATDLPFASDWFDTNLNIFNITPIGQLRINTASCSTPDVTVNLGTRVLRDFAGVNQPMKPAPVPFNIAINNCPAGVRSIQYMLTPNTASLGNGVVSLDAGVAPVATGVGIQLLDGAGNPVSYNVAVPVSGVTSGTGGSYTVPLKATYFQTAASLQSGSANTSFTFTIIYQ